MRWLWWVILALPWSLILALLLGRFIQAGKGNQIQRRGQ